MNEILIARSILIFMFFWAIGIVLLWFRPRIEIFWKIVATLILALYAWFFIDEILKGFDAFLAGWYVHLLDFVIEFLTLVFMCLFFIWPISLMLIFYKVDDIGSERLLKFISVLTLVLWILFILYYYYNSGIDKFLFEKLRRLIPNAQ
ncbi:MAG: hypothetical protein GY754_40550 [bacterium]|nr:hypothetical protein [bacterium]